MYTFFATNQGKYKVGKMGRMFLLGLVCIFALTSAEESSEAYVKQVLRELKKEDRTSNEMVTSFKQVLEPRLKKDSTRVEILTAKEGGKTILKMKFVQESGSGLVETTKREFHYSDGNLIFITVLKKLENTFVKNAPFFTERRVFVKDNEIVKTTLKQGSEKGYKRSKFYAQTRGTQSWKEAETLCSLAQQVKKLTQ